MYRVRQEELPYRGSSHNFVGADHGDVNISVFLFNGKPDSGPGPHRHPYDEIQFIQAGRGRWTVEGETFEAAGFEVTPHRVLHYDLLAFGFRASANGSVVGYSGYSGPSAGLTEIARDADLFVCEATLLQPNPEGGTRGHLSAVEAQAASEAAGAKRLLLTHRPQERPLENGFELATDGLEIYVAAPS